MPPVVRQALGRREEPWRHVTLI